MRYHTPPLICLPSIAHAAAAAFACSLRSEYVSLDRNLAVVAIEERAIPRYLVNGDAEYNCFTPGIVLCRTKEP